MWSPYFFFLCSPLIWCRCWWWIPNRKYKSVTECERMAAVSTDKRNQATLATCASSSIMIYSVDSFISNLIWSKNKKKKSRTPNERLFSMCKMSDDSNKILYQGWWSLKLYLFGCGSCSWVCVHVRVFVNSVPRSQHCYYPVLKISTFIYLQPNDTVYACIAYTYIDTHIATLAANKDII